MGFIGACERSLVVRPDGLDGLVDRACGLLVLVPVQIWFRESKKTGVDLSVNRVENRSYVVPRDREAVNILVEDADGVGWSWGGRKMVYKMVDAVEMKVVFLFVDS